MFNLIFHLFGNIGPSKGRALPSRVAGVEQVVIGFRNFTWALMSKIFRIPLKKMTQRNTNYTASDKSIFKNFILYEVNN
jgi:hypothetical protein